jgi:thiol-disulfide isomerase/thioredoxin
MLQLVMKKIFISLFLLVCLSANAVEKKTNFSEEIFENAKASGKTVVVNSYEVWCGTCSKQTKILDQAEKEFTDIVFLSYEQSKNEGIAQKLGIKFWTTIVVYKGNDEVARIIGQTDKETIYSAIQKGI